MLLTKLAIKQNTCHLLAKNIKNAFYSFPINDSLDSFTIITSALDGFSFTNLKKLTIKF